MKRMNYVLATLFAMLLLTFTSCDKDETPGPEPDGVQYGELSFGVNQASTDVAAKNVFTKDEYPTCSDAPATTVHIVIEDALGAPTTYTLNMTALAGETEVLKLPAGDYTVTEFAVKDANDNAIYTIPTGDSKAALAYGLDGLPHAFTVLPFEKIKEEVDVLCYEPGTYQLFGYAWFQYHVYVERELFFFGDICTKFFEDWHLDGTPYNGQSYDGYDFAAIFRVDIYRGQDLIDSQTNVGWQGVGAPLSVKYIDDPAVDNEPYSFEIWLTMPDGTDELVHSAAFQDGISSEDGDANGFGGADGVFDFAVGSCDTNANNDINLQLPSWIPVPTAGKFLVKNLWPSTGGYVTAAFKDIMNGHDDTINTGVELPTFCAAKADHISLNTWYEAKFYSSLDVSLIPTQYASVKWGALNWILNNQTGHSAVDIQNAIWHLTDGTGVTALATLALANETYVPKIGEYAIILMDAIESTDAVVQLMIVKVDP